MSMTYRRSARTIIPTFLPAVAVALLISSPNASAAASVVQPPLGTGAQPLTAIPVTDSSGLQTGGVGMQISGVAAWWLESCSPAPAATWSLGTLDRAQGQPANVGLTPNDIDLSRIGWPVAIIGTSDLPGSAPVVNSGCLGTAQAVSNETTTIGSANSLASIPAPTGAVPVLPGQAVSSSPSMSIAALDAPTSPPPTTSTASTSTSPSSGTTVPAPRAPARHSTGRLGGFLIALIASLAFGGWGLSRARAKAAGDYGVAKIGHAGAEVGHHLGGEVAPLIGLVLALVAGGLSGVLSSPLAFVAAALSTFALVERWPSTTTTAPSLTDYLTVARRKPFIIGAAAVIGVVSWVIGFRVGLVMAVLGIALVAVLTGLVRGELRRAEQARQAVRNALAAVLGCSAEALDQQPGWGVDATELWVCPLPSSAHGRLLSVPSHEAEAKIADSLPAWEIAGLSPTSGLRLVPASAETLARRAALRASGGLFTGETSDSQVASSGRDAPGTAAPIVTDQPSVPDENEADADTWLAGW